MNIINRQVAAIDTIFGGEYSEIDLSTYARLESIDSTSNPKLYVERIQEYVLNHLGLNSIKRSMEYIREGFELVKVETEIRLTSDLLTKCLCKRISNSNDFLENFETPNLYKEGSGSAWVRFQCAVQSLTINELNALLKFITGLDTIPVRPKIVINWIDMDKIITAHTCHNTLDISLQRYTSEDIILADLRDHVFPIHTDFTLA